MSKIKGMFASFFQKEEPSYTPLRISYIMEEGHRILCKEEEEAKQPYASTSRIDHIFEEGRRRIRERQGLTKYEWAIIARLRALERKKRAAFNKKIFFIKNI